MDSIVRIIDLSSLKDRLTIAQERITELETGTTVNLDEFYSPDFMVDNTQFESFDEFCDQFPHMVETDSDQEIIPSAELDDFVVEHTRFSSWNQMRTTAAEENIINYLAAGGV